MSMEEFVLELKEASAEQSKQKAMIEQKRKGRKHGKR